MVSIREYAISVIAAALLCSVITDLLQNTAAKGPVKLICGMVLTIVVAAPLWNVDLRYPLEFSTALSDAADAAVRDGEALSREALYQVIKQETQAYIQDKAAQLGADLSIRIDLSEEDLPLPQRAVISGRITTEGKRQLQQILQTQLGIAKENVLWTG